MQNFKRELKWGLYHTYIMENRSTHDLPKNRREIKSVATRTSAMKFGTTKY